MMTHTILNQAQKDALVKASQAAGLSHSAFLRQAAIEKMNKMGIQISTSQGNNLDSPATNAHTKGADDATCQNATDNI